MDQLLRSIYYDVKNPSGFASASKLYEAAVAKSSGVTLAGVKDWLLKEYTYSLHHPARRNFVRNPIVASCIGDWCQADLVDMQAHASQNKGYRYILTFIDVFSKKADAVALKTKSMSEVAKALEKILKKSICFNLLTDRGKEFENSAVEAVMKKYGVRLRLAFNESIKASVAERFNRTLKSRMHRYFTGVGTRKYIDVLPSLIDAYNESYHRSIRMKPNDVSGENSKQVFENLYGFTSERDMIEAEPSEKQKFFEGDTVRLRYNLSAMDKSYFPLFSDQTYTVSTVFRTFPRFMYRLKDWEGKVLERKFYSEDLLKVSAETKYRIEKVLKRRGSQMLVKWTGYPHGANSWIPNE